MTPSLPPADSAEPSGEDTLAQVRAGDYRVLDSLYRRYARAFADWAAPRHPELHSDDLDDAFQRAIIVFFEHVRDARLTTLTAKPRTYIFGAAHRICLDTKKKLPSPINVFTFSAINSSTLPDLPPEMAAIDLNYADLEEQAQEAELRDALVSRAIRQLSADCRRLLTAFYFDGQSLTRLADEFSHRDVSVTAVRKSQCLSRLRTLCGAERR